MATAGWGGGESGPFNFGGGGGSNQFFSALPGMPNPGYGGPGQRPGGGNTLAPPSNPYQVPKSGSSPGFTPPYYQSIHGGQTIAPQYPGLAGNFVNWLMSQMGQGMTPFNLSTPLPTGGATQSGQLTAGPNPMLQQLMSFFQGGQSNAPGSNTLSTIANNGISALPEWQSMVKAMQDPIAQQTSNLREQFASMGNLAGSPFANAMSNFGQQTALQQESLLGQLQQQNILQGQIPVAQQLQGEGGQLAQYLQGLNQSAIQNQYGEFVRTQPQNNPMLQDILSMSQTYPPTIQQGSGMGGLGALLGGAGTLAGGLSQLPWGTIFGGLGSIFGGGSQNYSGTGGFGGGFNSGTLPGFPGIFSDPGMGLQSMVPIDSSPGLFPGGPGLGPDMHGESIVT